MKPKSLSPLTAPIFSKIDSDQELSRTDLIQLLDLCDPDDMKWLYQKAYELRQRFVGDRTYLRGIIEFSNICRKDCYYCGIRRSNTDVSRYQMSAAEILDDARWAYNNGYGSIVLQSGERDDREFLLFVDSIIREIKSLSNGELGITLSLGEQNRDAYQRWFDSGAHRYLLRIETANPMLYKRLHPRDHYFSDRKACLKMLKEIGYQVGTGVLIGLPFQSVADLADDLLFYRQIDIDMIGMGPYIIHEHTPLAAQARRNDDAWPDRLATALKMIAVARIFLKDVNIAATTALQALAPDGREMGLLAGANVIMPNVTRKKYRQLYQLYPNKPCIAEDKRDCIRCLRRRIEGIGETIGFNEWGDSPHFKVF